MLLSCREAEAKTEVAAEPLLISMMELERVLSCSKTTAFKLVTGKKIESVMVGRRRMPVYASVKRFVADLREQALRERPRADLEAAA